MVVGDFTRDAGIMERVAACPLVSCGRLMKQGTDVRCVKRRNKDPSDVRNGSSLDWIFLATFVFTFSAVHSVSSPTPL